MVVPVLSVALVNRYEGQRAQIPWSRLRAMPTASTPMFCPLSSSLWASELPCSAAEPPPQPDHLFPPDFLLAEAWGLSTQTLFSLSSFLRHIHITRPLLKTLYDRDFFVNWKALSKCCMISPSCLFSSLWMSSFALGWVLGSWWACEDLDDRGHD